jgi:hypothetical protein
MDCSHLGRAKQLKSPGSFPVNLARCPLGQVQKYENQSIFSSSHFLPQDFENRGLTIRSYDLNSCCATTAGGISPSTINELQSLCRNLVQPPVKPCIHLPVRLLCGATQFPFSRWSGDPSPYMQPSQFRFGFR